MWWLPAFQFNMTEKGKHLFSPQRVNVFCVLLCVWRRCWASAARCLSERLVPPTRKKRDRLTAQIVYFLKTCHTEAKKRPWSVAPAGGCQAQMGPVSLDFYDSSWRRLLMSHITLTAEGHVNASLVAAPRGWMFAGCCSSFSRRPDPDSPAQGDTLSYTLSHCRGRTVMFHLLSWHQQDTLMFFQQVTAPPASVLQCLWVCDGLFLLQFSDT